MGLKGPCDGEPPGREDIHAVIGGAPWRNAVDHDLKSFAILMDEGPAPGDPTLSDRARVSTSLEQCFEFAATMTPEARRHIHIQLADGSVIGAEEIERYLATGY